MTPQFNAERKKAFEDIKSICTGLITTLAKSPIGDNSRDLSLPEYVETEQRFRWPAFVMYLASDLEAGKGMKQAFNNLTSTAPQPSNAPSGRESAFQDIYNALDAVERDFDTNYVPLDRDSVRRWQKKHPIEDQHIQFAHKEHTRHHMKESFKEIKMMLQAAEKPATGAKPRFPQP